jgi:hypothetical protein
MKINDCVAVLDEPLEGVIRAIKPNGEVQMETKDGMLLTYSTRELVVISAESVNMRDIAVNTSLINQYKGNQPAKKSRVAHLPQNERGIPEFDLHIEKLVPNWQRMTAHDILTFQLDTARHHIEFALKNRIPKIVLIHGVGEGVLKMELNYLIGRYDRIVVKEASYLRYGIGAIELHFTQK